MSRGLKDANAAADLFQQPALPEQPAPQKPPPADHEGHRGRLRTRFDKAPEALPDYELLELVLYGAITRQDTKPLAKRLLAAFNDSFTEVLNAPAARLKEVHGVGDRVVEHLKAVRAAALRFMQDGIERRETLLSSWDEVVAYCRSKIGHDTIERFHVLYLDKKNRLILDEVQQSGTVDHTPVYPREVIKRALDLSASAVILVHNHPSGDPTPSQADIATTRQIVEAARPFNIAVHDHLIVGRVRHKSLKQLKLM